MCLLCAQAKAAQVSIDKIKDPTLKKSYEKVLEDYKKNTPEGNAAMASFLKANPVVVESAMEDIIEKDIWFKTPKGGLYRIVLGGGRSSMEVEEPDKAATLRGTAKSRVKRRRVTGEEKGDDVEMSAFRTERPTAAFRIERPTAALRVLPQESPPAALLMDAQPLPSSQPDSADSQPPSPDIDMQITLGDAAETAIREALKGKQVRRACYVPPDLASNPWIMYHKPLSLTSACHLCRGRTARSTSRPR